MFQYKLLSLKFSQSLRLLHHQLHKYQLPKMQIMRKVVLNFWTLIGLDIDVPAELVIDKVPRQDNVKELD